jgi:hypothetical protein
MAVDHVKSATITNLDASPVVPNTAGRGAGGLLKEVSGYATAVASSSADATYQLVRIPSTAVVKSIIFESEAQTAGKFDLGLYYATDGQGGKPAALLAADAIDQDFFATVIDCAAAVVPTEVVQEAGTYTLDKRNQPIWQAVGLTSDPGGQFDIVATVKTTAITTGTGKFGVSVRYVE